MYISKALLSALKCMYCDNFLSVFPIYTYPDSGTYACGRCIIEQNLNPQRQTAYEKLVQNVKFPCRHENEGCVKSYMPDELAEHELQCEHRPIYCIKLPLGSCPWQGKFDELYDHYKKVHKEYIIERGKNKLDLFTGEQNYMLCDRTVYFIVNIEWFIDFEFMCVLSMHKQPQQYSYQLCFSNINNKIHKCPVQQVEYHRENLKNKRFCVDWGKVNLGFLDELYFVVDIIHKNTDVVKSALSSSEEEMLRAIECPVCMLFMVPPIVQCNTGHSICSDCKKKCKECPTCFKPIGDTRNFSLEMFTSFMKYPCKYRDYDCSVIDTSTNIREHENTCKYGPYACPVEPCKWRNKLSLMMDHVMVEHVDEYLDLDYVRYREEKDTVTYVTTRHGDVFKLYFECTLDDCYWALQLVGPLEDSAKYRLEIELNNADNEVILIIRNCGALTRNQDAFDVMNPYIRLSRDMLDNVMGCDGFTYYFRILLK